MDSGAPYECADKRQTQSFRLGEMVFAGFARAEGYNAVPKSDANSAILDWVCEGTYIIFVLFSYLSRRRQYPRGLSNRPMGPGRVVRSRAPSELTQSRPGRGLPQQGAM